MAYWRARDGTQRTTARGFCPRLRRTSQSSEDSQEHCFYNKLYCPSCLATSIEQRNSTSAGRNSSGRMGDSGSEAGSIEPWSPSAEEEARRRCELLTLELEAAEVAGSLMSAESASTAHLVAASSSNRRAGVFRSQSVTLTPHLELAVCNTLGSQAQALLLVWAGWLVSYRR